MLSSLFGWQFYTHAPKGVGDIFTFKTSPYSEFANSETGRYGAFKILAFVQDHTLVMAYDVVGLGKPPSVGDIRQAKPLIEKRFFFNGENCVLFASNNTLESELESRIFLANFPLTSFESRQQKECRSYGGARSINFGVEGEWRWSNDRQNFEKEQALVDARDKAKRQAEELRIETRLKHLTWDKLRKEKHFPHWIFPPANFTAEARRFVKSAIEEFSSMSSKPKKRDARRIILGLVDAFNKLEVKYEAIETEEREDIMTLIDEIAFVAKHRDLVDEADEKRNW